MEKITLFGVINNDGYGFETSRYSPYLRIAAWFGGLFVISIVILVLPIILINKWIDYKIRKAQKSTTPKKAGHNSA